MEKLIAELKQIMKFKDTTEVGDIVLILAEEEQRTLAYAVVTGIERDESRKDEWWHVSMQLLSVPLQPVVWTLRTAQFTGQETFTMGGRPRFVKAVQLDHEPPWQTASQAPAGKGKGGLRLVK